MAHLLEDSKLYWKLPKDDRWLGDSNTVYEICGMATDVSQIGHSLYSIIRNLYKINSVPEDIVRELDHMQAHLDLAQDAIYRLIDVVSKDRMSTHQEALTHDDN